MKKDLKKAAAGLLAITLLASMTACSSGSTASTTAAATTAAETVAETAAETEAAAEETEAEGDGSLARVQAAGKFSVGAEGNWAPYVYNDTDGKLDGFEVAMAAEIASRLGVEIDEEKNISDSWDGVLAGLDAGRYDAVICGCSPNPERQEMYSVSDPYGEQLIALVVRGDNEEIQGFEDLNGKTSANSLTSSSGKIAAGYGATLYEASLEQGMMLIQQERADCTINDAASINAYLEANPDANIRIAAYYVPENAYEIQSAVVMRKEDKELCEAVNQAIADIIADGTAKELATKYFGEDFANNVTLYQ
ncbi:MAG: transporter substrate-binding domain-containing protein [Clostridiales bacterium]|nr:transporter substrate-binding domain-containing protein [Clostridiales bacterium]